MVEVDSNHFGGLRFVTGSNGSDLRSLGLVNAAAAGVTINRSRGILVVGNFIGVGLDGSSFAGNGGNGLELISSSGNTIGGSTAQTRNIISDNSYAGILLCGSSSNRIVGNFIGTDVTGTVNRGNGGNGILLSGASTDNTLGGDATGGNDPTDGVFVRPPQGNLISGNDADGVLISGRSSRNTLEGNFIGTDISGNTALGNSLDRVAIENSGGNVLVGCAFTTSPFVFYNVVGGNGGNGLRITNADSTTVQGTFFGLGADNRTAVGNHLNGVVVEGSSANTVMGGPIPLGNVVAANGQNGILVQGMASRFVTYNTFCGLAAFETYTNLGNGWDGMKITSTGGNIRIRTNVIAENRNDGIEISGAAHGVPIAGNIIGLDTQGNVAMGNKWNGVEVTGNAYDVVIGGPQPTFNIIPHNAISANDGNGVAITGNAHDVRISFSFIGTDLAGMNSLGNAGAGVFIGTGTHAITVGSTDPNLFTVISGNRGDGVEMRNTSADKIIGCLIGTDVTGLAALPNQGDGVFISNSSNNVIGRTPYATCGMSGGPANLIAFNGGSGVFVASGNGNAVLGNSIYGNARLGIDLGPGANRNQAAPVLTSLRWLPLAVQVVGTLTSTPNTLFTIEIYAGDTNAPSGRISLGFQKVRTNASGVATFTYFSPPLPNGTRFVTATATDPMNNTSEFSGRLRSVPPSA